MARALVTGSTGFVGSHIARALVDAGHHVRALHRKTSKLDALAGLDYETAIGDLDDADALREACAGRDWVFHVAAVADYWRADQTRMFDVNVEGTRSVLQAAKDSGVQRVVFTSSAAAVGLLDKGEPANESVAFNLPRKLFPYAYSKVLAEGVAAEFADDGLDVVTVNPVVVMGPGDLNMISGSFVEQIKKLGWLVPVTSGGVAVVDVRDVARWHIKAAELGVTGERYILGTANYGLKEWYGMIADVVGVRRPFIPTPDFVAPIVATAITFLRRLGVSTPVDAGQTRMGVRKVYYDASKAWKAFGEPQIDMDRSLRDTYDWYRDHGYIK